MPPLFHETASSGESPFLLGNAGEIGAETEGVAGERAGRRSAAGRRLRLR